MSVSDTTALAASGKLKTHSHDIELTILSKVPLAEYSDLAIPDGRRSHRRQGFWSRLFGRNPRREFAALHPLLVSFNAALWLRLLHPPTGKPFSLWLQYEDADGLHQVLVDEVMAESAQLMLAGEARFRVQGYLKDLSVALAGCSGGERYAIDELFVQRKKTQPRGKSRPESPSKA